jgi:hypothetical protein
VKKAEGGGVVELVLGAVEVAAVVGFGSGAAVAAAVGQFVLAVVLGLVAFGVFLRFKRGRLRRKQASSSSQ